MVIDADLGVFFVVELAGDIDLQRHGRLSRRGRADGGLGPRLNSIPKAGTGQRRGRFGGSCWGGKVCGHSTGLPLGKLRIGCPQDPSGGDSVRGIVRAPAKRGYNGVTQSMSVTLKQFVQQLTSIDLLSADELQPLVERFAERDAKAAERLAKELIREKKLTAFQAQAALQGKAKNLVLGNYVILDKLGQGGMGMVLKAQHKRMDRVVALKVLSRQALAVARRGQAIPSRGASGREAAPSEHRHGLRRRRSARHALPGDGVRRRERTSRNSSRRKARCRSSRRWTASCKRPAGWNMPTARGSSIATSSRPTCCSTATAS